MDWNREDPERLPLRLLLKPFNNGSLQYRSLEVQGILQVIVHEELVSRVRNDFTVPG
jgi:hypothetical protein